MTTYEARIIVLEDALRQAQNTVKFLHGCLTDPEGHSYEYPERTADRLKTWAELVPLKPSCHHSCIKEDCTACQIHRADRALLMEARYVLDNKS